MKQFVILALSLLVSASLSAQWALQKTNASENYNTLWVDMVDANTVWASLEQNVGGYYFQPVNKVVRTIDGGRNWTTHTVGDDPNAFITSIFALNAQELWVLTINYTDYNGKMYATRNGGLTFEEKLVGAFNGNYPDVVHFFDAQHGIVLADPILNEFVVFTTSDGGNSWIRVPDSALPDAFNGEYGDQEAYGATSNVAVFGTINISGSNTNRVLRTPDRGQTWQAIDLPTQSPAITTTLSGIAFSNDDNALLVQSVNSGQVFQPGSQPKPLRTINAGLSWEVIEDSDGGKFDEYGTLVHVPGTDGTFLAGNYDGYAFTKDYGLTWNYFENRNFRVPNVDCIDAYNCYGSIWSDVKNTGSRMAHWVGYQLSQSLPAGTTVRMKASPNPASGPVTVTFSEPLPAGGMLFMLDNSSSYLLTEQSLTPGQTSATFNVGSLTPGIYWLKAVVGNRVIMEKFFKN